MRLLCSLLVCLSFCAPTEGQTIRRVNPYATGQNVYRTAQEAHDAASAGDILLLEPNYSALDQGGIVVTKQLTIYGDGFRLESPRRDLHSLTFSTGSDGSKLIAVEIDFVDIKGVTNVKIERSHIGNLEIATSNYEETSFAPVSNIDIRSNLIYVIVASDIEGDETINSVTISNNLCHSIGNSVSDQNWIVTNNILLNGDIHLNNALFENNICFELYSLTGTNVDFSYNISSRNDLPLISGNQNNVDLSNEFVGMPSNDDDSWFALKDTSPLKTAGKNGSEVGAYGGATPYIPSGTPAIPSFSDVKVEYNGVYEGPITITFDVKANN